MYNLKVTVYDIGKFLLQEEKFLSLAEVFKDYLGWENKKQHLLKTKGVKLLGANFEVADNKRFTIFILSYLYPEYKIIDTTGYYSGHPDFILEKGEEKIYLEIKLNEDCIRESQIKWFIDNKDKNIKVMWISFQGEMDFEEDYKKSQKFL